MSETGGAVAVVGMAAVFPGAPDLDTYWQNILGGLDAISEVPASRWDPVYYDPQADGVDRFYCRRGGFVDTAAVLDPAALGVVPASVDSAEPDQLLALALAARALADGGGEALLERRERAGVIVGRGGYLTPGLSRLDQRVRTSEQLVGVLRSLLPDLGEAELAGVKAAFVERLGPDRPDAAIDLVPNLAASRVANRFDFGGPAYTVDAACASSLLAVDQACRELASGTCDLVLAGGVHLCHDVTLWSVFTQLRALSPSGVIRPFARSADGLLIGEGGGMVVLERLADAERRGARIYAVIRGTGVSSDGRHASLMRPSAIGQVFALERAWTGSGVDPARIGLLEAHGTATPTGDATELETLRRFFGAPDEGEPRATIGSVKSMIGHAMPAAGIAGFIKAALSVERGVLPPTLHCEDPHPLMEGTRFAAQGVAAEWEARGGARVAAVSAFGFGGINAHVVLEQHEGAGGGAKRVAAARAEPAGGAPAGVPAAAPKIGPAAEPATAALPAALEPILLLAAPSLEALSESLAGDPAVGSRPVVSSAGAVRLALVNPTPERLELARKVIARGKPWRGRNDLWFTTSGLLAARGAGRDGAAKLAFVFPGVEPTFEPKVHDVAALLGAPLPQLVGSEAAGDDLEGLGRSIVAVGRLLHAAVGELGLRADVVAGQSIGEWSGMIATAMIPPPEVDGFIATLRPGSLEVPGVAFAALACATGVAESLMSELDGLAVSHDNCPHQTIVCGPDENVRELLGRARAAKVLGQVLPFRSGFHTKMFSPFVAPFREALARLPLQVPQVPLWSATTCAPYPEDADDVRALALAHLVERVRFRELVLALHDDGVRVFVQVGAGSLPGLIEDTLHGREILAVASNSPRRSGVAQLLRLGAACWVEGCDEIDFDRLSGEPAGDGDLQVPGARPARPAVMRTLPLATPLVHLPPGSSQLIRRATGHAPGDGGAAEALRSLAADGGNPVADELRLLLAEVATSTAAVVEALSRPVPAPPPATVTSRRVLSLDAFPSFADHCFYRQPPGWPSMADRFPVVPMTAIVQFMIDAAGEVVPQMVPVGVEDVRAFRWLAVAPPVEISIRADAVTVSSASGPGERRVRVVIDGYARATVVFRPSYEEAPPPSCPRLAAPAPIPVTPEGLYADRWLFHGPAYQGVTVLGPMGEDGIDGELEVGAAPGAVLDNAGQLMGFWVMFRHETDRLGLPTSIDRIRFFGPAPAPGGRVVARVRVSSVDATAVRAELEIVHDGRLWVRIDGWEDRRFDSDDVVWPVLIWPESSALSEPLPGGWELAIERWRSSASRELMMRRYLSEGERAAYESHNPRAQRTFLLGRIAAKDAVRRWMWNHGGGPVWPAEIEIRNEPSGRPVATNPSGLDLRVSIAHTPFVGVAMVAEGVDVGIDVEHVEPRSESFARAAFTINELEVLLGDGRAGDRDEWLARGWAAKEAVAKAAGTGLGGRPRSFVISACREDSMVLDGRNVVTTRIGDLVVAWTPVPSTVGGHSASR